MTRYTLVVLAIFLANAQGLPRRLQEKLPCEVPVRLQSGWVCGVKRVGDNETVFASFLGVPYAAQPVGERRFSELEPVKPWNGFYDASAEGPICPQHDVFYGKLLDKTNMTDACINANIHVPIDALPDYTAKRSASARHPQYGADLDADKEGAEVMTGLPILVFVHGGGFAYGSDRVGVYGPEYMIQRKFIIITFNYRINVFGFLSLNSSSIPGNNGLRDCVTLLRWVHANARTFGGNPNDITLGGHSASACLVHLLTMSKAAEGLFQRAILMSGTAVPGFYNPSPKYAQYVANLFLSELGVDAVHPEAIHQQLVKMPLRNIMKANRRVQDMIGATDFHPVIESRFPNFTTIIDTDPEILLSKGFGKDIPLIVGFTNKEAEAFRPIFEKLNMLQRIEENPTVILSPNVMFNVPEDIALEMANRTIKRYFNGNPTMDKYIKSFSDTSFVYPAIKLAEKRAQLNGAPLFLYRFSYTADFSPIKEARGLKPFKGAAHLDDLTFIFRANAMNGARGFTPLTRKDRRMVGWMTRFVANFIHCDAPICNQYLRSKWPPVNKEMRPIRYQDIEQPMVYRFASLSKDEQEMVQFFDSLKKLV